MEGIRSVGSKPRWLTLLGAFSLLGLTMCEDAVVKQSDPQWTIGYNPGMAEPPEAFTKLGLPADCQQIIFVSVEDGRHSAGHLTRYEKDGANWKAVDKQPFPVMLGHNGLQWGLGLHQLPTRIGLKQEGDRTAPAGIFELGTAFGYAPKPPQGVTWPYRQATAQDYFVDDGMSEDYNTWQTLPKGTEPPWDSFERMRREDGKYELGLVVEHNMGPAERFMGSAIFLHIWGNPPETTAGCTAMDKANLTEVLKWLDPDLRPLLIQVPLSDLTLLKVK